MGSGRRVRICSSRVIFYSYSLWFWFFLFERFFKEGFIDIYIGNLV